ncbi:hypothetical protein [Streptomyces sp. NBC_00005]|uniref:hypothetical protein n=1 Tax=Streptomyces sp. NBC_00005 TaxID=2903609 RepID=UPI0032520BC1
MEGVNWSLGDKSDRIELQRFDCCPGCRADTVRHPQDRRPCVTPWAHEVQAYFRQRAISHTNGRRRSHDQRLLLLHDASDLAGAAVHTSTPHPSAAERPTIFERRLEFYAIASDRQGQTLSNGEYAAQALLRAAVTDITSRHDPRAEVFLTALVHPENKASQRCLERYGWLQRRTDDATYLLFAAALGTLQKMHGVIPPATHGDASGPDQAETGEQTEP